MKKLFYTLSLLSTIASAQPKADQQAIKSMCGCYEVTFNFAETFAYPSEKENYKPSQTKLDTGLEWVVAIEDKSNKIVLQHLLIVNDTSIIKHWRQDWIFQNRRLLSYNGFNDWKTLLLKPEEVKGQWTQKVFQVDDSPRYDGTGVWQHKADQHIWESTTHAPLPRREFTIRNDYNLLERRNRHEITSYGWLHEQDNKKIIRNENGQDQLLAFEKGYNTYVKVDDKKCMAAQTWWQQHKQVWSLVRAKWDAEVEKNEYFKLKKTLDEKPIFMHLFALKQNATQAEVNALIDQFFEIKK